MAYEIEIKSLLGSPERAQELRDNLSSVAPNTTLTAQQKQLNHYFKDGDIQKLYDVLAPKFSEDDRQKFKESIERGSDFSVRTRLIDDETLIFVVKVSLDAGTSHNTVARVEFEARIDDMTLDALDQLILDAGFSYQAKWSREREEYACDGGITVCLDRNAGYGYLAEFEKVLETEEAKDEAEQELRALMERVGAEELPQGRLERMFAHYNEHWPEYYGTDRIFTVE